MQQENHSTSVIYTVFYKIIFTTSASVSVSMIGEMATRIDVLANTLNKYLVAQ